MEQLTNFMVRVEPVRSILHISSKFGEGVVAVHRALTRAAAGKQSAD